MPSENQRPPSVDPANRTSLAWTRTAVAFAAIGGAMLKVSPVAGCVVLLLSVPIWLVAHRPRSAVASSGPRLRLVTVTVVIVALAALAVAIFGHSPNSLGQLLRGR